MDQQAKTERELAEEARAVIIEEARTAIAARREKIEAHSREKDQYTDQIWSSRDAMIKSKRERKELMCDIKKLKAEVKSFERVIDSGGKRRYQPKVPEPASKFGGGPCIV